jgi:ATP-dependent RNA helicase DDX35
MAEFDLSASFIPSLHKPAALLPIARHRQSLLYLIETYPVTIVVGQTGSGKTTQIPQYLEQAGWCSDGKVIAVTQASFPLPSDLKLANTFSLVESQRPL